MYNSSPLSELLFYLTTAILFVATVYIAYRLAIKSNTREFTSFFNWLSLLPLAQLGAYAYLIQFYANDGVKVERKGMVLLVK